MMKKQLLITGIISIFMPHLSFGGELAKDTEIVSIANTSGANNGSADDFWIKTNGGTGLCAGEIVRFPSSSALNRDYYNRAFSIALAAFTTGNKKVRIASFQGDDCLTGAFIEITK